MKGEKGVQTCGVTTATPGTMEVGTISAFQTGDSGLQSMLICELLTVHLTCPRPLTETSWFEENFLAISSCVIYKFMVPGGI